jgi:hypothetical protein
MVLTASFFGSAAKMAAFSAAIAAQNDAHAAEGDVAASMCGVIFIANQHKKNLIHVLFDGRRCMKSVSQNH